MTVTNIIAGVAIAAVIGLLYYINYLLALGFELKKKNLMQADLLLQTGLENEHLKKKLEKISELAK